MLNYLLKNVLNEANRVPRIRNELCVNCRTSSIFCRCCEVSCPANAAKFSGKLPYFDRNLCEGCGTCAATCISGALVLEHWPWHTLLKEASSANDFTLGCAASMCSTVKIPCLGGMSGESLATITLLRKGRPFTLDLSPCFKCSILSALQQLWRSLDEGKILLGRILPARFAFVQTDNKPSNLTTRREMLHDAGKQLLLFSEQTLQKYAPAHNNATHSPRYFLLTAAKQSNNAPLTFPTWNINDACRSCGRCQSVCPHQAWRLVVADRFLELWHYPWRCTGCDLCEKSCPAKAMLKGKTVVRAQGKKAQLKRSSRAIYCSRCKLRLVSTRNDESLCPVCQKKWLLEKTIFSRK